ncbi:MAG: DUF1815 family protein [Synechococcaceae cyanobacterium]|nr:DUF1815 family protein [Synechococcaceae cyanobacterium]
MFVRLADQYRCVIHDLVLSLQALADCLRSQGRVATCYVCGEGSAHQGFFLGAAFVADLGDGHTARLQVSSFGITWIEARDGLELVKLEGAEAIEELQRVAAVLQQGGAPRSAIDEAAVLQRA